jgi:hypothetical protein
MNRPVLPPASVHPAIAETLNAHQHEIIEEVQAAVAAHPVVVVGMKQNPFPRKARKLLTAKGTAFHYLENVDWMANVSDDLCPRHADWRIPGSRKIGRQW